jgi:hypothetical protein
MTIHKEQKAQHVTQTDDGQQVIVIEWQTIITTSLISGPRTRVPMTRSFTLANGSSVNQIDDNTFQVVQTDQMLRKV